MQERAATWRKASAIRSARASQPGARGGKYSDKMHRYGASRARSSSILSSRHGGGARCAAKADLAGVQEIVGVHAVFQNLQQVETDAQFLTQPFVAKYAHAVVMRNRAAEFKTDAFNAAPPLAMQAH